MYFFTFVNARGMKAVTTSKNRIWPNVFTLYIKKKQKTQYQTTSKGEQLCLSFNYVIK